MVQSEERRAYQKAYHKARRAADPERVRKLDREQKAAWRAANKEKFRKTEERYRAERRAALALVRELQEKGIGALL